MNKAKLLASAQHYLRRGQNKKAIAEYEKLLKEDPHDVRSLLNLANIHYRQKHYKEAVSAFLEAARYYEQGGFALKTIAVYKQVLTIVQDRDDLHMVLAGLYQSQGRLNEAAVEYRQAMNILNKKNDRNGKLNLIRLVLEMDPDNIKDRLHLAEAFSASGQIADAVLCFRKVADLLERHGKTEGFQRIAERMLYHQADDAMMAKKLAASYAAARQPQRALSKIKLAFKAAPRDLEVLGVLVDVFNQLGQVHKAVTVLKHMARLYGANGLSAEADECYQEILAISPEDDSAKRVLATTSVEDKEDTGTVFVFDDQMEGDFTPAFPQAPEMDAVLIAESDSAAAGAISMTTEPIDLLDGSVGDVSSVELACSEHSVSDAATREGGAHVLHEILTAAIDESSEPGRPLKDSPELGNPLGPQASRGSNSPEADLEALFRVAYDEVEAAPSIVVSEEGGATELAAEAEWDIAVEAFDFGLEGLDDDDVLLDAIDVGEFISEEEAGQGIGAYQEITSVDVAPIGADETAPLPDDGQDIIGSSEDLDDVEQGLAEELRELDFYLANGLVAEARVALTELNRRYENHPKVIRRQEKLETMG